MDHGTANAGIRLKLLRVGAGVRQYRVAQALGLPPTTLCDIENGRRPVTERQAARIRSAIAALAQPGRWDGNGNGGGDAAARPGSGRGASSSLGPPLADPPITPRAGIDPESGQPLRPRVGPGGGRVVSTPNVYPGTPTAVLLEEREVLAWQLVRWEHSDPTDDPLSSERTAAVVGIWLERRVEELERRERPRSLPGAPAWPDRFRHRRQEVQVVKANLSVVDVLRRRYGVNAKPHGQRWVCRCPLPGHDDRTPSFTVFPDGGWHCFGCREHGDALDLVRVAVQAQTFGEVLDAARELLGAGS